MFFLIILIIHILCVVLTYLGIASNFFKIHKYMFFVVLFLPFWGFVIMLLLHFRVLMRYDGRIEVGVEKMKIESEVYKSVSVENKNNTDSVIPIEEALIVNSAKERRELIMDVLNDNPKNYIDFLKKAGNNDDTEVVHYAVTAMVEISKENDYILQQLERNYSAQPESFECLKEYGDYLWHCLSQNLMQGQVEIMNRKLYSQLVKKMLSVREELSDYMNLVNNEIKLNNYTAAGEAIEQMDSLWPDNEDILLLKLKYYASIGRGNEIKRIIDDIDARHVYLSSKAKEAIVFWKN